MNVTVQVITAAQRISFSEENDIEVIGSFNSEQETLEFAGTHKPAIILLGYEVEKTNSELFIQSLLIESPESKVILIGNLLSDETILNCLISAIYGYMEWQDIDKFLHKAICSVGKGEAWVSRRLVGLLIRKLRG
ncbi:MAG: hypothetical protein GQ529_01155 [Methyloprofundus sp.]|nr:hypothetical protein [Methyloprofundus sp.]